MSTLESIREDARRETAEKDREYFLRCEEEADRLFDELRAAQAQNKAHAVVIRDLEEQLRERREVITSLSNALKTARDERDRALDQLEAIREVLEK